MAQELIYTSYPKGVKPGVSGFCTVAHSPNMAPNLISRLEGLSGYRHLYMPGSADAALNPPNLSHVIINVGGIKSHVLYRVGDAGQDYTGRSNKLAHFIILGENELVPCGPATALMTPGLIDSTFDQQVGIREFTRPLPRHSVSPRQCIAWRQITGDPGWAGELAQTAYTGRYACIIYNPGTNVLPLIQEASALLPQEMRWKITFSTYYSKLPAGIDCQWRCVAAGTEEAANAAAEVGASGLIIDLTTGTLGMAPNTPAAAAAREGKTIPKPVQQKTQNATRRPRATTVSTVDEAAINAGIQDDLSDLDSSNAPIDNMDMQIDQMPVGGIPSIRKTQVKKATKSYTTTYIVIASVPFFLLCALGVGAIIFSNNSKTTVVQKTDNPENISEPANENNSTTQEPETDKPNNDNPDQASSDSAQQTMQADEENEQKLKAEKEEAERKDREEAEAKAKAEKEAAEKKAKEETEAKAAEEKRIKEEKEAAEKKAKEEEEKLYNDPRWVGAAKDMLFIYVEPNNNLVFDRLNYQLKKLFENNKQKIEKLELVQITKSETINYKLEPDPNNPDIYNILDLTEPSVRNILDIKIIVNNFDEQTNDPGFQSNHGVFRFDGEMGAAQKDQIQDIANNYVFRATFTAQENKTDAENNKINEVKIISLFRIEKGDSLKTALENARTKSDVTYDITSKDLANFKIDRTDIGCYKSNVKITVDNKEKQYAIFSRPYSNITTNWVTNNWEIKIERNDIYQFQEGMVEQNEIILNQFVCFIRDASKNIEKIKIEFELQKNLNQEKHSDNDATKEDKIQNKNSAKRNANSIRGVKSFVGIKNDKTGDLITQALPLYIDVYINGFDQQTKKTNTEPFLWKRLVLPKYYEKAIGNNNTKATPK